MKIKDYRCKCGCDDLFFKANGNQTGIYCGRCGKWFKWADKDERNLIEKEYKPVEKTKSEQPVVDNNDADTIKELTNALDRAKVLLKATYDLLQKQQDSPFVLNILDTTAEWDGAECDGYCLQEDIDNWFLENFDKALSWDEDDDN